MSSFGKIFRVTTFGESHSPAIGGIVEGLPSCFPLDEEFIQTMLNRRKPGQSNLTTKRNEADIVKILSGMENGLTLGTPIGFMIQNQDVIKKDYSDFKVVPRPGHADFTYLQKYGIKAESGGGRASARETACRVVGGAIAENYLNKSIGTYIVSWVSSIGDIEIPKDVNDWLINEEDGTVDKFKLDKMGSFEVFTKKVSSDDYDECLYKNVFSGRVYSSKGEIINEFKEECEKKLLVLPNGCIYGFQETVNVRCPHEDTALRMISLIKKVKLEKDSIGGTITCVCKKVPAGLGEPCFDKIPALLAHAMLSIPATKGFEIGSGISFDKNESELNFEGFAGTKMKGSEHNDLFVKKCNLKEESPNKSILIKQKTNNAGGILGGISSGEHLYFRVAFKPVSTIGKQQKTVDLIGNECLLEEKGRHDPCILPRASPIVEAMAAMVIMDFLLQQNISHKVAMPITDYQI